MRTILLYRLYGRDGVDDKQFEKLKDWGIVKKRPDYDEKIHYVEMQR